MKVNEDWGCEITKKHHIIQMEFYGAFESCLKQNFKF